MCFSTLVNFMFLLPHIIIWVFNSLLLTGHTIIIALYLMKVTLINNYNFLFGGMSWIHFYFTLSPNSRTISFTPVGQSILGMGLAQKKKNIQNFYKTMFGSQWILSQKKIKIIGGGWPFFLKLYLFLLWLYKVWELGNW